MTIKSGLVTGKIILLGENDNCELKGGVVKGIVGENVAYELYSVPEISEETKLRAPEKGTFTVINSLSYDGTNNADNKVCKLDINLCFFS